MNKPTPEELKHLEENNPYSNKDGEEFIKKVLKNERLDMIKLRAEILVDEENVLED